MEPSPHDLTIDEELNDLGLGKPRLRLDNGEFRDTFYLSASMEGLLLSTWD